MKKSEVVRLKQVEHIKNEKEIMNNTQHPFIVTLCVAHRSLLRQSWCSGPLIYLQ